MSLWSKLFGKGQLNRGDSTSVQLRAQVAPTKPVGMNLPANGKRKSAVATRTDASSFWVSGQARTVERFYEDMSRDLIGKHGPLISVDQISSYPDFGIRFTYKDGTQIYSRSRTGHYDIHFLTLGYVGEGPRYARRFLAAAGFDLTIQQIENVRSGDSIQLKAGKTVLVRQIDKLAEGDVNARDKDGLTALWYAIKDGNADRAKALISAGADVNEKYGDYDHTVLMRAAGRAAGTRAAVLVKILIAAGADVNVMSKNGETALMEAADNGDVDLVEILIAAGADVMAKAAVGGTALRSAATKGNTGVVKTLIAAGVDVSKDGGVALRWASAENNANLVETLIAAGADVNQRQPSWTTALMEAAEYRKEDADVVRILIAAGADVNATGGKKGETALMRAYGSDKTNVLIAADADVNARNDDGDTALMRAGNGWGGEIGGLLIAAGAEVNAKNNSGRTALMWAAEGGHRGYIGTLIAAGADVNAKDNNGNTALMWADKNRQENWHAPIAEALIAAGADVNLKNNDGETALAIFSKKAKVNRDTIVILKAAGATE
jgi:ankyrin repeat protein